MTIEDPVLLIRINQLYRHGMPAHDSMRQRRRVEGGPRREEARYALAVFEGVSERLRDRRMASAGSVSYTTRDTERLRIDGRWIRRASPRRSVALIGTLIAPSQVTSTRPAESDRLRRMLVRSLNSDFAKRLPKAWTRRKLGNRRGSHRSPVDLAGTVSQLRH